MKRLIPLAVAGAALAAAAPASAAVDLAGGDTRLTLAKGTAKALASLDVSVAPTGPATAKGRHVRFPISGGAIDPASAAGRIAHTGGLRLKAGGTKVVLKNYRVKVGRKVTLSAVLAGKRVTILDLTGTPKVTRPGGGFDTTVGGLTARLNRTAARALNGAFGVTAFKAGLPLGKVKVVAEAAEAELQATGGTALAIDAGTLGALTGLGITPGVVGPATLTGTTATFPITGGKAALDLSAATVAHSGGISLTKGGVTVRLTDFDIRVGATRQLFASVNGGAEKVAIIDLDLSALSPAISGRSVTLSGITAKLTQGAADALNAAFSTTAFAAGLTLGTATVSATAR